MANLSITTAWNEAVDFVKREAGLILPVAFLLLALPGAVLQILMQPETPTAAPEPGWWLLILPVGMVASIVGSIAITYLALRPGTSVGESLQMGLRRFIMLFLAYLLIMLAFVIVLVPLTLAFAGSAAAGGDPLTVIGSMAIVVIIMFVIAIAVAPRLLLMTPVATAENPGPIRIIQRSWELTGGHYWKLLGFLILLTVAALVVSMVIGMAFGIVIALAAGPPEPRSTSMILITIVSALVQSVIAALFVTVIARIYHQLTGGSPEKVFA